MNIKEVGPEMIAEIQRLVEQEKLLHNQSLKGQLKNQQSLIEILQAYLGGSSIDRKRVAQFQLSVITIKMLCKLKANVKLERHGSYDCVYCFQSINNFDQQQVNYKQQSHYLQCGHQIHNGCLRDLSKDFFEENSSQFVCECPKCKIGQGLLSQKDIQQAKFIHERITQEEQNK